MLKSTSLSEDSDDLNVPFSTTTLRLKQSLSRFVTSCNSAAREGLVELSELMMTPLPRRLSDGSAGVKGGASRR